MTMVHSTEFAQHRALLMASVSLSLLVCKLILVNTVTQEQYIMEILNLSHRFDVAFGAPCCVNQHIQIEDLKTPIVLPIFYVKTNMLTQKHLCSYTHLFT